jgi:cell wall-associated NlpC family hydrolase
VYLPHQSKLQYNDTMRVPISELQPGDLVFYGSSPSTIYHVALYIGGDTIIEAPFAGGYVRTYSVFRYGDLLPYGGRVLS